MKQATRFFMIEGLEWKCIYDVDMFIPNLYKSMPFLLDGVYYFIRFIETKITADGYIVQDVFFNKHTRKSKNEMAQVLRKA